MYYNPVNILHVILVFHELMMISFTLQQQFKVIQEFYRHNVMDSSSKNVMTEVFFIKQWENINVQFFPRKYIVLLYTI